MTANEAGKLVEVIAESLRANPGQFHLEVSMIGAKIEGREGGTGLISTASAPGSTGTVINSSVGPAEIRAGEIAASEAVEAQFKTLDTLAQALADDEEDEVPGLWQKLKDAAVLARRSSQSYIPRSNWPA